MGRCARPCGRPWTYGALEGAEPFGLSQHWHREFPALNPNFCLNGFFYLKIGSPLGSHCWKT